VYGALLQAVRACYVDNPQAHAAGMGHGIGRAAGWFRQVANANTAVIHKVLIAFLYAV